MIKTRTLLPILLVLSLGCQSETPSEDNVALSFPGAFSSASWGTLPAVFATSLGVPSLPSVFAFVWFRGNKPTWRVRV